MIDRLAADCSISKRQASVVIDSILHSISTSLVQQRRIEIGGLGVFSVYERAAKRGIDPRSGKVIQIASRHTAKLKTGHRLMQLLNEECTSHF